MSKHKQGFYEKYIKRPQDFICALLALIVLSPVLLIVAILVKVKLGSPIIFAQERPGLNGKIFKLYKFRTMSDAKDENGNLLPDEERLGHFGKLLRSTSLDELPELVNIIRGELSVCGDGYIIGTTKKTFIFKGCHGLKQSCYDILYEIGEHSADLLKSTVVSLVARFDPI
jgi:lipopolysaccharide/colanic/teichoic acid biosynthesis glycosyltransferase